MASSTFLTFDYLGTSFGTASACEGLSQHLKSFMLLIRMMSSNKLVITTCKILRDEQQHEILIYSKARVMV